MKRSLDFSRERWVGHGGVEVQHLKKQRADGAATFNLVLAPGTVTTVSVTLPPGAKATVSEQLLPVGATVGSCQALYEQQQQILLQQQQQFVEHQRYLLQVQREQEQQLAQQLEQNQLNDSDIESDDEDGLVDSDDDFEEDTQTLSGIVTQIENDATNLDLAGVGEFSGIELIGPVLERLMKPCKVTHLDLSNNALDILNGAEAIADMLQGCPSLKSLNLVKNQFGDYHIRVLGKALCSRKCTLESLTLDWDDEVVGSFVIADLVDSASSLKYLHIPNSTSLNTEQVISLANALKKNDRIQSIEMAPGKVSIRGFHAIADMLASNKTLRHFSIEMGIDDTQAIANCRGEGIALVFDALCQNSTLQSLKVAGNAIGYFARCVTALGHALTVNDTLRSLDISDNNFHLQAGTFIAKSLAKNRGLESLRINENPMWPAQEAFANSLQRNHHLQRLECIPQSSKYMENMIVASTSLFEKLLESNHSLVSLKFAWRAPPLKIASRLRANETFLARFLLVLLDITKKLRYDSPALNIVEFVVGEDLTKRAHRILQQRKITLP